MAHIVEEAKSPDAPRNASDQFFECGKPEPAADQLKAAAKVEAALKPRSLAR